MWSLLGSRLPLKTSETMLGVPKMSASVNQGKKCIGEKKEHSPFLPQGEQEWLWRKEKGRPGGTP